MFENIVRKHNVECRIGIGNRLTRPLHTLVQVWVHGNARVRINAADPRHEPPKVHLRDDTSASAQI
jgi:hypothetical protein